MPATKSLSVSPQQELSLPTMSQLATFPHSIARHNRLERILVATDGSAMADAAFRVAAALARRCGAAVEVLSVVAPAMPLAPEIGFVGDLTYRQLERERNEGVLAEVRRQAERASYDAAHWPVDVAVGHPASVITRVAHDRRTDLIVQGIRLHRKIDRLLGQETVLKVVRLTDAAVLAVHPELSGLPRRAMVAVDFSRSSIEAARRTLKVVDAAAHVSLVHVDPHPDLSFEDARAEDEIYRRGVDGLFARLLRELSPSPDMTLETVTLRGERMRELIAYAERERVDLIAVGSHGHTFFERLIMGSVVMKVVRSAGCSVLITPPEPARGLGLGPGEDIE